MINKTTECCPCCGTTVEKQEFQDALSLKEYKISGLCQQCQDDIFVDESYEYASTENPYEKLA